MKDETKNILGISCLYVTAYALFALLGRLVTVYSAGSPLEGIKLFLNGSMLWLVVALVAVYVLYSLNAKQKQGYAAMLNNPTVRKTTGILIALTGLFNFAASVPILVNVIASFRTFDSVGIAKDSLVQSCVTQSIALLIQLCQSLFGLYLLRYKSKTDGTRA